MSYTISDLKENLTGILHSTDLSRVKNPFYLFNRKANELLGRIDPVGTKRIAQITNAIHSDIYDYTAPTDLKGDKIIDIFPQANRTKVDIFSQRFSQRFASYLTKETFHVRDKDGTKILRLAASIETPQVVHSCESLTDNGTWAADGTGATGLVKDTLYYYDGSSSLKFNLAAGQTTGYIQNSTMAAVDLSDEDEVGSLWVRIYLANASLFTSVGLRWGNDASNYWTGANATAPHDQSTFKNGWNVIRFDWSSATETGTVAPASIDYVRVTVNYSGAAATDIVRVDKITASLGKIYELEYYSNNMFQTAAGTWKENSSGNTDIINLDQLAFNIYVNEVALGALQQVKTEQVASDRREFMRILGINENGEIVGGLYAKYEEQHPSEAITKQDHYWDADLYD